MDWHNRIDNEIESARAARALGNEGRARVCARRAAGIVASNYLLQKGIPLKNTSSYALLVQLQADQSDSLAVSNVISHLLMQVDSDFLLPPEIDLIAETHWLAQHLLDYSATANQI